MNIPQVARALEIVRTVQPHETQLSAGYDRIYFPVNNTDFIPFPELKQEFLELGACWCEENEVYFTNV